MYLWHIIYRRKNNENLGNIIINFLSTEKKRKFWQSLRRPIVLFWLQKTKYIIINFLSTEKNENLGRASGVL